MQRSSYWRRTVRRAVVLAILLELVGCAPLPFEYNVRAQKARAEILEMERDCLAQRQADPRVDCSQFVPVYPERARP